jgi:hypothetical protein
MIKRREQQLHIVIGRLKIVIDWSGDTRQDLWAQGVWITANGVKIPVEEMSHSHLVNAAGMLARQAWIEAGQTEWAWPHTRWGRARPHTRADVAQALLTNHAAWPHIQAELEKRGLEGVVSVPWKQR